MRAYSLAMQQAGVELRERTPFLGLRTAAARGGRRRVTGVLTPDGVIKTERVVADGWPEPSRGRRDRGRANLRRRRAAPGGRPEPHPAFDVERQPMVFDVGAGIYWRLEEGGLLWGISNPKEKPGPAREVDWPYLRRMQRRLNTLVPVTVDLGIRKAWCGTIDYTPDHLPILGPVITTDGTTIDGATVASPGATA